MTDLTPIVDSPSTQAILPTGTLPKASLFRSLGLNSVAVLHRNGEYFEGALFTYHNHIYAKIGTRMVRLKNNGVTSNPKIYWANIHGVSHWKEAPFGLEI